MSTKPKTGGDSSDNPFEAQLEGATRARRITGSKKSAQLRGGTTLLDGRLRIEKLIGQGGMGVVYAAYDEQRNGSVALKTLNRIDAGNLYRLKNEFRSLALVSHPHLVRLYELFEEEGQWFFTMELLDGESFDRWVRPGGTLDEARLRMGLAQLCEGVVAIHAAGKLHRDLKPSNVLVTGQGRVVVLDFGLVSDPDPGGDGPSSSEESGSGTPWYMAPEQVAEQATTAASDFYAMGVMLFQALTGRLPFEGNAAEVLVAKRRGAPPSVSAIPNVPSDLASLCDALLALDQRRRPNARALRAFFGRPSSAPPPGDAQLSLTPSHRPTSLLGREEETEFLRDAFFASCSGKKPVVVFLAGESGIGKSALCEAFLTDLRTHEKATVLSGRCFERERVPFKAFDMIVDELSKYLRQLSEPDLRTLLPRDAFALRRLFPVLGRIPAIAEVPSHEVDDAHELRRLAFAAFSALLCSICERRPLVMHLDDLQWSDADSTVLLMHLLRKSDPPRMLLIAGHRSEQMEDHPFLTPLYETLPSDIRLDVRVQRLQPLPDEAAHALLQASLGRVPEELVREAGGNPFLLGELSRHAALHSERPLKELSLKQMVLARTEALPDDQRTLLQVLAVAAQPIDLTLAVQAAGIDVAPRTIFEALRDAHLARATGEGTLIECYHDKVREALRDALTEDAARAHHAALAWALSSRPDTDAEQLAGHLLGAGESERAAVLFARAADDEITALSFDRAVRLYAQALEHGRFSAEEAQRLRVERAEALARAGRGPLAAEACLSAMQTAVGDAAYKLEQRAGEQYLLSGRLEQGRKLLARSLKRHGEHLPTSSAGSIAALFYERARLRMRGLKYELKTLDPVVGAKIELLANSGGVLAHLDFVSAAMLGSRRLRIALDSGDATEIANGFSSELAWRSAGIGNLADAPMLMERIEALIAGGTRPDAERWYHYCRGFLRHALTDEDPAAALSDFDRFLVLIDEQQPPETSYLRGMAELQRINTLVLLGRFTEVAKTLPGQRDDAWERGDFSLLPMLAGAIPLSALLAVGAQEEAQRAFVQANAAWSACENAYTWQDLQLFGGMFRLALARGEFKAAWDRAQKELVRFAKSQLRAAPRIALIVQSGALYTAVALAARSEGSERTELLRHARKLLRNFRKEPFYMRLALPIVHAEGRRQEAIDMAQAMLANTTAVQKAPLWDYVQRRSCGLVIGGEQGRALIEEADTWLRERGAVDPAHFVSIMMPGIER